MERIPIGTPESKEFLRRLLKERGRTGEHNPEWILCIAEGEQRTPYIMQLDSERALLAFEDGKNWSVHEEPLTKEEHLASTIRDFCLEVIEGEVEKVTVELKTDTRKELLQMDIPLHIRAINYTMDWPVYDMHAFDASLPGGTWKHLRNARNGFYRSHEVRVIDAKKVPAEKLHALVDGWKEKRPAGNRTYAGKYHVAIDTSFAGFESARVMMVDGMVAGLNGGWQFPHKKGCYYGAVGIHDYAFKDIGAMLYLEDLCWIKDQGYDCVDMAGGEGTLNTFKNQFHPTSWYKTHVFSIAKE